MTASRLCSLGYRVKQEPGLFLFGARADAADVQQPTPRGLRRADRVPSEHGARGHHNGVMSGYLWVKAFHIVFVSSWFAGLFYLPRLFVNLAAVPADSHAERERLLLMARKLYRFSSMLMVVAIALGLVLWLGYGVGLGAHNGWLHAKLLLVVLAIGFHHGCRSLLRNFEQLANRRRERWFRVFNELAIVLFTAIVILVVVKPF